MGEIKQINLGGESEKSPVRVQTKQVLQVSRRDLDDFVQYFVSRVQYGAVVLKGGYMLSELLGVDRYTADVDMSIQGDTQYDTLALILQKYGELLVASGRCSRFEVRQEVIPGRRSGGAEYWHILDNKEQLLFSVDISAPDCEYDTITVTLPLLGKVVVSSLEQVSADKISVMFSRKRFRRIKDLFDLYYISKFDSVDLETVAVCLARRGRWPLDLTMYPFTDERREGLRHAYERFYLQTQDGKPVEKKPDFMEMIESVSAFIDPLLGNGVITDG